MHVYMHYTGIYKAITSLGLFLLCVVYVLGLYKVYENICICIYVRHVEALGSLGFRQWHNKSGKKNVYRRSNVNQVGRLQG